MEEALFFAAEESQALEDVSLFRALEVEPPLPQDDFAAFLTFGVIADASITSRWEVYKQPQAP
jgi:hypothetical protein